MSHFVVAVIVPGEKLVDEDCELNPTGHDVENLVSPMLQPFHEYECTGIEDEYVVDVDCTEDIKAECEKYGGGQDIVDYAHAEGYKHKDGKFFRKTNPNAKWDWWVVGGRWSGILVDTDGGSHDYIRAKDYAFKDRFEKALERQGRYYDDLHAALAEHRGTKMWGDVVADHPGDIEAARKAYREQPGIIAAKAVKRFDATPDQIVDQWDGGTIIGGFMDSVDDWIGEKEIIVRRKAFGCVGFFAILDHEGWHARGDMGWWGVVHGDDKQDDYVEGAIQRMLDLDPEDLIVTVDCHI